MENKKLYCDLHTHSTRSDGTLTRAGLIRLAIENDIGVLAITDHNVPFDDIDELQAKYPDIKLINGSEISTRYQASDTDEETEIHIIALDFKSTEHFRSVLLHNRFNPESYINSIIQKLREAGADVHFTYDELWAENDQEFIGRMAIARKLVNLGIVSDTEEAFDEYIGDYGKKRAYVRPDIKRYIPMDVAVIEILRVYGIPVLCHPYSYNFSEEQVRRLIQDFKACGGVAMETMYSQYTSEQQEQLKAYAEKYELLQSAASDFHGGRKKDSLDCKYPISICEPFITYRENQLRAAKSKEAERIAKEKANEAERIASLRTDFFEKYLCEELSEDMRCGGAHFAKLYKNNPKPTTAKKIISYIKAVHCKIMSENGSVEMCGTGVSDRTRIYIRILNARLSENEIKFAAAVLGIEEPRIPLAEAATNYSISKERINEISDLLYQAASGTSGLWIRNPLKDFLSD